MNARAMKDPASPTMNARPRAAVLGASAVPHPSPKALKQKRKTILYYRSTLTRYLRCLGPG
eukprot:14047132-Heterocapsa_arctica.AAC.1